MQEQGGYLPPDKSRKIVMWYQQGLDAESVYKLPAGSQFKVLFAPNDFSDFWRILTYQVGAPIKQAHEKKAWIPFYVVKDSEQKYDHDPREDK